MTKNNILPDAFINNGEEKTINKEYQTQNIIMQEELTKKKETEEIYEQPQNIKKTLLRDLINSNEDLTKKIYELQISVNKYDDNMRDITKNLVLQNDNIIRIFKLLEMPKSLKKPVKI